MKKLSFVLLVFFAISNMVFSQTQINSSPTDKVPIGTIVAWAGNKTLLPEGWLICNGDKISSTKYRELCEVLSDRWGPTTVNNNVIKEASLPDLRGMFLRGVNEGRTGQYADPDANNSRDYENGNKPSSFKSNEVGSYQADKFENHTHKYATANGGTNKVSYPSKDAGTMANMQENNTTSEGGSETRPNNAYVYWIIRAK